MRAVPKQIVIRARPYVLPRPCGGEDDERRLYHDDLADMTPLEAWSEHQAATAALAAIVRSGRDPVIVYGTGWTVAGSTYLRERIARTPGELP